MSRSGNVPVEKCPGREMSNLVKKCPSRNVPIEKCLVKKCLVKIWKVEKRVSRNVGQEKSSRDLSVRLFYGPSLKKTPNFWSIGPIELKFWHLILMRYYKNIVSPLVPWECFWTQAMGLILSAEVRKVQKQIGTLFEVISTYFKNIRG